AKSCSTAWTATACARATTWRSCARYGRCARCRWWPRAAPASRSISKRRSSRPTWTERWRPACSTAARCRFRNSSGSCAGAEWRCAMTEAVDDIDTLAAIDWGKAGGLVPAVVQDARTLCVLMLGYMDRAALEATLASRRVTFFSRSKGRLSTKGESSGHYLELCSMDLGCDGETVLVLANANGPSCHLQRPSCFPSAPASVLAELSALVESRASEPPAGSYTTKLFDAGVRRIAQKVGEEGVETALAAVAEDDDALLGEAADLLFHLLVLLRARGLGLAEVEERLRTRSR